MHPSGTNIPSVFLSVMFWALVLWALADSVARWFRSREGPARATHTYIPFHYVGGCAGLCLWALGIGAIDYEQHAMQWLRPVSLMIGLIGWILTLMARQALGDRWTPDVVHVPSSRRITAGPYAFLQHPIYVGEALFFLGVSIYLASIPVFAFVFVGGTAYNLYRARIESRSAGV